MKHLVALLARLTLVFSLVFAGAASANCSGRVINPVTDLCWDCLMPLTIGKNIALGSQSLPDIQTDANPICVCGSGPSMMAGINLGFWEPLRTVEVVRHPYCFPSLGGMTMDMGLRAPSHGRSADSSRHTSFYQVHWYQTPWLFILEAVVDTNCLEQAPWDLAYLSELDPLWDDTLSAFILSPDAALFANVTSLGACGMDCVSANLGLSQDALYWCSGCQGFLFPLSGWVAAQTSPLQAWHLLAHRFALKLARQGLLWGATGKRGQCGPYFEPILKKSAWRTQLLYPTSTSSNSQGPCCQPLGRTTFFWGAQKTYPFKGEDGAILLWRRRDCCLGKTLL